MQLLDWIVVAVVVIIVLVIAHGYYVKWKLRRNRVVVKLERNLPQADVDLDLLPNSELPNGGARTIPRETEPVIPRKRYQLKDGRDKIRQSEPEPANVPVLMDTLQIEETDIEHANVYVSAATAVQETAGAFADEELPPEVMAGLDTDTDEFIAATEDPLAEPDSLANKFAQEEFEAEFDEVSEQEAASAARLAAAADQQAGEEATDNAPLDEDGYEDEAEYDPYEDENFYENEPALLENAYKLATRSFKRQQEPQEPRIEPGFGEAPAEEVESSEQFSSTLDEAGMEEFLGQEQEEIRAWRNQSVTQQQAPAAATQPAPAVNPQPRPAPEATAPRTPAPAVVIPAVALPALAVPAVAIPIVPIAPTHMMEDEPDESDEPMQSSSPPTVPKVAEPARESKPGFWQTMTGKTAKAVKPAIAKIDQGELFQTPADHAGESAEMASGPQEVVIVNVMAQPGAYFYGDELLPVLQHFGLRLGKMSIFHRHTDPDGTGPVMFSMANMVKPGTFALNGIENFATPGVSFFVQLPNRHGNMKAFEHMLATANGVKQAMDGILKDERRSVLTRQTVEHCRQRIRDFELALLAKK